MQAALVLPHCEIYLLRTFPRIVDLAVPANHTVVLFSMVGTSDTIINGQPLDHPSLVLGRGPTDYRMVQGVQTCVAGIRFKSAMLAALDKAFLDTNLLDVQRARSFQNSLRIVKHIDARLSANWGRAIYSDELASELRISVRTMHTAMLKIRGMSLHRYLRLRRL
jgi:hypothetical protein